jgi:predicted RNase H-like HicB family nuclease
MLSVRVELDFDDEAKVWWVSACDVPGVRIEAPSLDTMMARLPGAVADMLEDQQGHVPPFEVLAQARAVAAAA